MGLGSIAKNMHIPVLSSLNNVIISSAAEKQVDNGKKIADKWGIKNYYDDYNIMYESCDLDAVFICLPNFLHYNATLSALKHDINVFCEKPMGTNVNEAQQLVKTAQKKDLNLGVGYNRRLMQTYQNLADTVNSYRLGRVLQTHGILVNPGPYGGWIPSSDWFFKDIYNLLYDLGSHLMDLFMFILSNQIVEVYAQGVSTMYDLEVIDNISGFFKTEDDILGSFNIGWRMGSKYDAIQVHGTGASVFANSMETEFRHASYSPLDKISDNFSSSKKIISTFIGNVGSTAGRPDETYFKEIIAFLESINNEKKPLVTGEDAINVLKVLESIKKSLNEKKEVHIK